MGGPSVLVLRSLGEGGRSAMVPMKQCATVQAGRQDIWPPAQGSLLVVLFGEYPARAGGGRFLAYFHAEPALMRSRALGKGLVE